MIKKFANTLFRIAYGTSLRDHDEALRLEWLTKGHERGQAANRTGCPFNLYLTRTDLTPDQQRVAQGVAHSDGTPQYRWWGCVDMTTGAEANLGTVDVVGTPQQALAAYLKYLPDDMRKLAGMLLQEDVK